MAICAILSIGNELLDGRTVNTNAAFFAESLRELGIEVSEVRVVGDFPADIGCALADLEKYRIVIVTGGLGPTVDDLTAAAVAKAWGEPLVSHPRAVAAVRDQLKKLRSPYTAAQARQANLPKSARVLRNTWGIAPGFMMKRGHTKFFFLPGVPRECRPMFAAFIRPVVEKLQPRPQLLESQLWRCFGRREADIFSLLKPLVARYSARFGLNFDFSSQLPYPLVDIRVDFWRARDSRKPAASARERKLFAEQVSKKVCDFCFARERISLAYSLQKILQEQQWTVATAESCTGGMVAAMLTDSPGSSQVFWGGVTSYANSAKEELLGVSPGLLRRYGAVSKEVAIAMAEGIRQRSGARFGLSLTGVSGPGGGSPEKPVGTIYVGISSALGSESGHLVIKASQGDRLQNRTYASHLALDMLRKKIIREAKALKRK